MSDTQRRYRAIRQSLNNLYPFEGNGHAMRQLNTLTAMICGIVGSQKTHLPQVAGKAPAHGILRESLIKRFSRYIKNALIDQDLYFLPYTQALLSCLSNRPLSLIIDGSTVGRGCTALVISVVVKKRALPVAFLVKKGTKGHWTEKEHLRLVEIVHALMPPYVEVTFLGDGEFDGIELLDRLTQYHWSFVCRTAKSSQVHDGSFALPFQFYRPEKGHYRHLKDIQFTQEAYGPIQAIIWWGKEYEEPLYLISNLTQPRQVIRHYQKRFSIETFFSDTKSRGFHLHKSHLSDPERLERLMIATCLAYIWIVYLGLLAEEGGWIYFIHRSDRCDLSLFQLGLRLLDYFFNEAKDLPDDFHIWVFVHG